MQWDAKLFNVALYRTFHLIFNFINADCLYEQV